MSLCEKYAPYTINGLLCGNQVKNRLLEFGSDALGGKHVRPIIIYGPSGIGKTTAAHAIANINGLDLVELSASDYRDSETLRRSLLPLSTSRGLFSKKSLILFDEIDEISSKFDSGCEPVISKLIRESRHPIVFIANDYWSRKVSFLRNVTDKVEFKRPSSDDIAALLHNLVSKEKKEISGEIVAEIAKRSNGDIRGAINDLEIMLGASLDLMECLGTRDRKSEIFKVLDRIFLSSNFDVARNAMMSSDVELDMVMNWVAQNIPNKYSSKSSIFQAYDVLSRASMFNEKASRKSYYGYLRYASVLTSSGVALASNGNVSMLNQYDFPSRIRRMSATKKDRDAMASIAQKLSIQFHASKKTVLNQHIQLMSLMIKNAIMLYGKDKVFEFMEKRYSLNEDEVAYVVAYRTNSA
jgi:replication factor C large subunit